MLHRWNCRKELNEAEVWFVFCVMGVKENGAQVLHTHTHTHKPWFLVHIDEVGWTSQFRV